MKLNRKQTIAIDIAIAVMQKYLGDGWQDNEIEEALDELIAMRDKSEFAKRMNKKN